eukprot:13273310-Heterocapsa_arctica.AAC.1
MFVWFKRHLVCLLHSCTQATADWLGLLVWLVARWQRSLRSPACCSSRTSYAPTRGRLRNASVSMRAETTETRALLSQVESRHLDLVAKRCATSTSAIRPYGYFYDSVLRAADRLPEL